MEINDRVYVINQITNVTTRGTLTRKSAHEIGIRWDGFSQTSSYALTSRVAQEIRREG